ncbi:hypothetical protein BB987_13610 [Photorhabdus temperata]|uniref:Uncharacterized protein n=1 Tax=Photorhabdus stackebrandtii TaxID=1123042 RepID=A0A7X5QL65_9GAMM|nr:MULTISPECIES: hypothetical protein [Photorhabdus]NHB96294.1 hypothetical protein [Photorhabdus stackebrandtii]OHV52751.1 hypothetical protein BB987_13610 [Photorhabdus temperata]
MKKRFAARLKKQNVITHLMAAVVITPFQNYARVQIWMDQSLPVGLAHYPKQPFSVMEFKEK